ncbi:MAG: filamentous hemagglutinin N-terminal domain-containing protein [Sulfuritalea sp.]|nr:filamentous hemagglutinin N-terminal domain-containing protein [Sulfuritalea sp.]
MLAALCAFPSLAAPPAATTLPDGGRVTAGAASISQSGARMDVTQTTDRAVLEWNRFDIGAAAQVNCAQPSASSISLNRVLAGEASQIYGRLTANGQVWLINPAGVMFGPGSRVDVGGLVASTLDTLDADFLAGKAKIQRNGATGKIVNQGEIATADGGLVALLAPEVRNEGIISARLGNVVLAAGERVTLDAGADGFLKVAVDPATISAVVENRHVIQADGGQVLMSAQAADRLLSAVVANSGTVQARALEHRAGRILLLADMDHGEVRHDGLLDASAPLPPGGGGAGGEGANGGFIETSAAKVGVGDTARVTTLAENGQIGTWLIDPNDYPIAASAGNITGAQLATNLGGTNITISTATQGTAGGNGDIFVNDAVSWSANTTLSLQAQRDIRINANITATGNGAGLILGHGAGRNYYLQGAKVTLSGTAPTLKIGTAGAEDNYIVINSLGVAGDATTTSLQGMKNNLTGKYALGSDIDAGATAGWNGGSGFLPIAFGGSNNNGCATCFTGWHVRWTWPRNKRVDDQSRHHRL